MSKPLFFDLNYDDLSKIIIEWEHPTYRTDQIWEGLYKQLHSTPQEISTLPNKLTTKLIENYSFSSLEPISYLQSKDKKTTKYLFELSDGNKIETVLMEYNKRRLGLQSQSLYGL